MGLRARSSIAFGLLALVLSSVLAGFTYNRSRIYLLQQRDRVAVAQAGFNARLLANALRASPEGGGRLLASVINGSGSQPMLFRNNTWYVTSANIAPDDLPSDLRRTAIAGVATRQRFMLRGQPQLAVAVPITVGARTPTVFVATTPLTELQRTLTTLATTLAAGAFGATIIGAVLGLYASRRVLRPLSRIADTAEQIAAGDLDARLSGLDDPDLTRLVATFNAMTDSLEERIQREQRFASHVSHELRSPLTALRGAMDLVRGRGVQLPERAQLGIDLLEQQVGRFERMVLDLLEMATIEAGAATVDLTSLSVVPLLKTTMLHVGADSVPIDVAVGAAEARVIVDARRFERIIDNLIGNANRHAGGATCVRIIRDGTAHRVRIHIDDAGPGVAPNERSRIFDRFARGAQGRHLAGAGLGLALVKEHVRLMRGTICVSDSPDGGARFTFDLPEAEAP